VKFIRECIIIPFLLIVTLLLVVSVYVSDKYNIKKKDKQRRS